MTDDVTDDQRSLIDRGFLRRLIHALSDLAECGRHCNMQHERRDESRPKTRSSPANTAPPARPSKLLPQHSEAPRGPLELLH